MNETEPKQTTILVRKNGPFLVTNLTTMVNAQGEPLAVKEVMSLCRCGGSKKKPYCDGSHRENGFNDDCD